MKPFRVDWSLLRGQKDWLMQQDHYYKSDRDNAMGLVHLIDAFQDAAVRDGWATEEEVFGVGTRI